MRWTSLLLLLAAAPAVAQAPKVVDIVVDERIELDGPRDRVQLVVTGKTADGKLVDVTHLAKYRSGNPSVAKIGDRHTVAIQSDGSTTLDVSYGTLRKKIGVQVTNAKKSRQLNFENDIIPLLSRYTCNTSGCHGKAEGQNGFKLSVFGFQSTADYDALVKEGRGRRVNVGSPDASLLLTKPSGGVPHGGGIRFDSKSDAYQTIREWIGTGMPVGKPSDPHITAIAVYPSQRQLKMKSRQQLRIVGTFSDGRQRDVTRYAQFQTNNETVGTVNEHGVVRISDAPGEVAIMATYRSQVAVFRAIVAREPAIASYPKLATNNFIDDKVNEKLRTLNILPSGPASDAQYLRRVYIDIIGTLPTRVESRVFLESKKPNKRTLLVDSLLKRPEFADYWALKWSDLLRVNRRKLGHKGAYRYYRWIRKQFAKNTPLDQFAARIITAKGTLKESPAGHFYQVVPDAKSMASTLSQVFLGVRIECAQCHHHPYDRWSQNDYWGMEAHFTQVAFKKTPRGSRLASTSNRKTIHPRYKHEVFAYTLGGEMPKKHPEGDRRKLLAQWVTSRANPWFAKNMANRIWAHFMGRGVVEPIDDFRLTNPPANPALLEGLADHLADSKYDLHQMIRTITASKAYQRASKPNPTNQHDEQNYSRFLFKRMDAEVLMDAISQTTGIGEKFHGVPFGSRAIQLWDSEVPHYFLKVFGRPVRVSACVCERATEPTVGQVLHVLNSPQIHNKISHTGGSVAKLVRQHSDDKNVVEELYLTFFNRFPTAKERQATAKYIKTNGDRQQAAEDIAWSMINSLEFLFNH